MFKLFNMVYECHVKMCDEFRLDRLTRILKTLIMGRVIYESPHKKYVNVVVAV